MHNLYEAFRLLEKSSSSLHLWKDIVGSQFLYVIMENYWKYTNRAFPSLYRAISREKFTKLLKINKWQPNTVLGVLRKWRIVLLHCIRNTSSLISCSLHLLTASLHLLTASLRLLTAALSLLTAALPLLTAALPLLTAALPLLTAALHLLTAPAHCSTAPILQLALPKRLMVPKSWTKQIANNSSCIILWRNIYYAVTYYIKLFLSKIYT